MYRNPVIRRKIKIRLSEWLSWLNFPCMILLAWEGPFTVINDNHFLDLWSNLKALDTVFCITVWASVHTYLMSVCVCCHKPRNVWDVCVCVCVCESLSCVWLFVTPWTVARQNSSPWSSPNNNTAVGFHPLLIGIFLIWVSCIVGRFFTIWTTKEAQCLGDQKLKDERKELSHTGFSRNLTLISPFFGTSRLRM